MFGIGLPELIIILVVALLVVGPSKLPEVARSVGKALGEFRRMADDVKESFEQELEQEDAKKEESKTPSQGESSPSQGDSEPVQDVAEAQDVVVEKGDKSIPEDENADRKKTA